MLDLEYYGVSKHELDSHPNPSLDGVGRFFRRLDIEVGIENTRIHARYDKERAADLSDLCEKVEALFRLGVQCGAAADAAVDLLARETYPSWRFMMTNASATMTLEAWAPGDKWSKWPARYPPAALPQEARSAPRAR